MKMLYPQPVRANLKVMMNRLGYHEYRSRRTGIISYSSRLGRGSYPRFHLYIDEKKTGIQFNLHIDAKQPSYRGQTAHSGEYDGPLVEQEMNRIMHYLAQQSTGFSS